MEERWCQWKRHMVSVFPGGLVFLYLIDCLFVSIGIQEGGTRAGRWKFLEKGISSHCPYCTAGFSVAMAPWVLKKASRAVLSPVEEEGAQYSALTEGLWFHEINVQQAVCWSLTQAWVDLSLHDCKPILSEITSIVFWGMSAKLLQLFSWGLTSSPNLGINVGVSAFVLRK